MVRADFHKRRLSFVAFLAGVITALSETAFGRWIKRRGNFPAQLDTLRISVDFRNKYR